MLYLQGYRPYKLCEKIMNQVIISYDKSVS